MGRDFYHLAENVKGPAGDTVNALHGGLLALMKSGGNQLHGMLDIGGTGSTLNSDNPFIRQFLSGESQGPLAMD